MNPEPFVREKSVLGYIFKVLVHFTSFFTSFTSKRFQTNRHLEDLHFQFLVTFCTVFPKLHLKVALFVHQCL